MITLGAEEMMRLFKFVTLLGVLLLLSSFALADPSAPGGSRDRMIQQGNGWLAGHTSVSDLSHEQKLNLLGWRPNPNAHLIPRWQPPKIDKKDLPVHLDWRENGGDFITPVRNQGECGSCYAFSGIGALEGVWSIRLGLDNSQLDLSEQFIVSCHSLFGCDGGWATEVFAAARDYGIPDEACFDYSAYDESCGHMCEDWALRTLGIEGYQMVLDEEADTEEEYLLIIQALQEGPLTVAFDVYEDFFDYEFGVYSGGGMYMGGHAVVLVGYDADSEYWICKNSWGSGWGESGYFRIRWGRSNFGREVMLAQLPPCTNEQIYVRPVIPGQDFVRYAGGDMPLVVRVASDCMRGLADATVTASVLDLTFPMYDDGMHQDEGVNDGIFGGSVPDDLLNLLDGEIEIKITASLPDYTDGEMILRGKQKFPADILIISNDGDREGMDYYGPIMDELGYSYDVWNLEEQKMWPYALINQAQAVFWFTGASLGNFEDFEEESMAGYLDNGGRILISGQDLLMNVYDKHRRFTREYFKVDKYWNDVNYIEVQGIDGEPLTDGLGAAMNFTFTNYTDVIKIMEGAGPIWRNGEGKATGLRYPATDEGAKDHMVVLSAFPIQTLPADQSQIYLQRVFDWFFADICFDTDGDGYPIGGACEGELDCANDYADTYPGAPEICDDGRDNNCDGLTDLDDPECEGWGEDDDTVDDDDDDVTDDDVTDDDVTDDDDVDDDDDDDDDDGCGCQV